MSQTIIDNDRTYVLMATEQSERNVFCYKDNKLLWQIEEPPKLHHTNHYTSIYLHGDSLCAYSQNGVEAIIDKNTGEILSSELIK